MTVPVRCLYLDVQPDPVFAMFHAAAERGSDGRVDGPARRTTGVLIVPPFGWNDVASYRSRRTWAAELAAAGWATLRIDLPGTGDSGGSPSDPDRVGAWTAAVDAAARWLRSQPGIERVAVIGLALGGLLAVRAAAAGALIDDIVLWATPAGGRQLVRQEQAFAALQDGRYSLTGEPEPRLVPDGWLEVNGFVLSAETMAALSTIDLATTTVGGIRRALLLETDGRPMDPKVHHHLVDLGIATERRPGPGWGAMTAHPERTEPPLETMATVAAWLDAADPARPDSGSPVTSAGSSRQPAAHDAATIHTAHGLVRESSVWVQVGDELRFGLLAEPVRDEASVGPARIALGAMFINAGAVRRIGPNRLWVETARRWAARGVPTLRLDLGGIGDSDGDGSQYREVGRFYDLDRPGADLRAGVDVLRARGIGPRIVLVGLCAGGYHAGHGAISDERVTAAIMLNPGALVWRPDILRQRDAGKLRRLLQPVWWSRLARGKVRRERIAAVLGAAIRPRVAASPSRAALTPAAVFDALRDRGVNVDLAFSRDEAVEAELERAGVLDQLARRWPNVVRHRLPGRDHTLRPLVAQAGAHAVLDAALERELARAAGHRGSVPEVASGRETVR